MNSLKQKQSKGFTLVELVVVVTLSSMILLAMFGLFDWHGKIYSSQQSKVLVVSTARNSMNEIKNYIALASRVLASQVISGTTYTSGASTMVLQLPSINSSDTVIPNTYDYVVFYLSGTKLYEKISANASSARTSRTKVLSEVATVLTFTYDNADFPSVRSVTASLQTQSTYNKSTSVNNISENIFLRNY